MSKFEDDFPNFPFGGICDHSLEGTLPETNPIFSDPRFREAFEAQRSRCELLTQSLEADDCTLGKL